MAKQDFSALIGKAKQTQVQSPAQKVVPVKEKKLETMFSLYIPTDRLKALKVMAAQRDITLKEMINSAIDSAYFPGE